MFFNFFTDADGKPKKKIICKISDLLKQGKCLKMKQNIFECSKGHLILKATSIHTKKKSDSSWKFFFVII